MNNKHTSEHIGHLAGQVLNDPKATEIGKRLAGSALSQVKSDHATGEAIMKLASDALSSSTTTAIEKSLAGSVLAQSEKKR